VWIGYTRGEVPMTNVHGVAVAGGNFPATIWHLFMLKATYRLPAIPFALPSVYPTYGDFTRGHYGYSYAPSSGGGSYTPSTSSTRATSTARGPAPPPTHVAPSPTTAPAPPPTTAPAPPPTTEPPPPPTP